MDDASNKRQQDGIRHIFGIFAWEMINAINNQ